ncbi:MAG: hypothetical protein R2706_19540 [Acidimicrobiales bacterium]
MDSTAGDIWVMNCHWAGRKTTRVGYDHQILAMTTSIEQRARASIVADRHNDNGHLALSIQLAKSPLALRAVILALSVVTTSLTGCTFLADPAIRAASKKGSKRSTRRSARRCSCGCLACVVMR